MMKQKQVGAISTGTIVLMAILGSLLILVLSVLGYFVSAKNSFTKTQNNIVATSEGVKTISSQYILKVREMAQVPAIAQKQMAELVERALDARYGEDGTKALIQFIKEQNPNIPPELYTNLQKTMSGGRSDIEAIMLRLQDIKRSAYDQLDETPRGDVLKLMNYPTKNIGYEGQKDDYPVILSQETLDAYKSGVDKGVDLTK